MSTIVDFDDELPPKEKPNLVINEDPYDTKVVDTRKEGYDTLSTYVAGSTWACDFYRQLQRRDDAAASFQKDLPNPYGQYELIRGLELVVTSPLTHSQEDEGHFVTRGSAQVYSVVTPNVGDLFIADVGNGRNALFYITSAKRAAPYREAVTVIEYSQYDFLLKDISRTLDSKVVRTVYFSKENFRNGVKAILTSEEVDLGNRLAKAYRRLLSLFMKDFFSHRRNTLLVPDQISETYDPFLTRFFKATVDERLHPQIRQIALMSVVRDPNHRDQTLFTAILEKDDALLYSVAKKAGTVPVSRFWTRPELNSIYYSGIDLVVVMEDGPTSVDTQRLTPIVTTDFSPGQFRRNDLGEIVPVTDLTDPDNFKNDIPLVHPVMKNGYYVFSEAFYEDTEGQSKLEYLVRRRIAGEGIDLQTLADISDAIIKYPSVERFYYIPIILAMIKMAPGVL